MNSILILTAVSLFPMFSGVSPEEILPPVPEWNGKSMNLMVDDSDPWVTPFETSKMKDSPPYAETMAWFKKLVEAAPELKMISIGKSARGREIYMILANKDKDFSTKGMRSKPLFLAHAGIHSGEIDGKDAGMMLLRDITVKGTKSSLLDKTNFIFIPILNVDGHERSSAFNRMNQRGPSKMGWRTNGRNLNLNRDFPKMETAGVRHLIEVINDYQPDLYFDLHVTDGADYQYDITFGYNDVHGYSPRIAAWMNDHLTPYLNKDLEAMGHIPGPLVFAVNNGDIKQGIYGFHATMRYSNGYGDARHLPTVLVENHSLKPFGQRVLGTYVLMESGLKLLAEKGASLRQTILADQADRPKRVPLTWEYSDPEQISFKAIESQTQISDLTGGPWVRWTAKPYTVEIPYYVQNKASITVDRPKGYWIPSDWPEIIEKLKIHGVEMTILKEPKEVNAHMYRLIEPKTASSPFEGRVRVEVADVKLEARKETFFPGSAYVSTDQPLAELIVALLEPQGPDSFFQWGYFLEALQRTEYFEAYAAEPLARRMIAENPELKVEYEAKVKADPEFAKSQRARLMWFYQRSPFMDDHWNLYPVAREH